MKKLNENWLTDGLIDFEYKKYVLLAYLQDTRNEFQKNKLYPYLSDLVIHYKNLQRIKQNKELLYEHFPKEVSRADFQKLKITYKKIVKDDELMSELESIVAYAIPQLKEVLEQGKEIYEWMEEHIEIAPVGISPLYPDEGYLFLKEDHLPDTRVFRYKVTLFQHAEENFRGINTEYIETLVKSLGETFESMKTNLIRKYKHFPNPATFTVISKMPCPLEESLLPISKRLLVKHLYHSAA